MALYYKADELTTWHWVKFSSVYECEGNGTCTSIVMGVRQLLQADETDLCMLLSSHQ